MDYREFIESKKIRFESSGIAPKELNSNLFNFQMDIDNWACRKGRAAIFADCGLGKTLMQLEWARQVNEATRGDILILAPLAVAKQTQKEGKKFGVDVTICRSQQDVKAGINIANYEMLHKFNAEHFKGVVLDESSILKSYSGKIRTQIIDSFKNIPYKLACTATPAPNDHMELGNHAEFLGAMTRSEMLSTFFLHDGGNTSQWRLKGHAEDKFWEWVASWAVVIRNPSDLGYDDGKFTLPKLNINQITVENEDDCEGLVPLIAQTLEERREARKSSLNNRVEKAAELVNKSQEQWLVWCDYNKESELLTKAIQGAVEVKGSDTLEHKENAMIDFAEGKIKALVTKPSIAGFGMNWQNCSNMIFCGLSDSYEKFYQAVRRCWRFGQEKEVNVHVIIGAKEIAVINNIQKKEHEAEKMQDSMIKYTRMILEKEIKGTTMNVKQYEPIKDMVIPISIHAPT